MIEKIFITWLLVFPLLGIYGFFEIARLKISYRNTLFGVWVVVLILLSITWVWVE